MTGLDHACGAAVDSAGNFYASSAGEGKVNVYDSSHAPLTSIANANTPCGLAVTTTGDLYVSEKATGEVVRYKPNAFPFAGTPTYGGREVIDSSGDAKGIAVDPTDNRLYVAEGTHIAIYKADGGFEANVGSPTLQEASGVAAYTSPSGDRYLIAADARGSDTDMLLVFSGPSIAGLIPRREVSGVDTPDGSFNFGSEAYLVADPGNKEAGGDKCAAVGDQACTAGHVFVYDAGHNALDELEASGEYVSQTKDPAFAPAEPNAMAIDRSGGAGDGTIYLTAGAGAGAKALAFSPLAQPRRKLDEGLSQVLQNARAVATDAYGNVYVGAGSFIRVFSPEGTEIAVGPEGKGIPEASAVDLAVDSECHVYVVLDKADDEMTYHTPSAPSACPPQAGTTYARHAPPLALGSEFPSDLLRAIAVDPGPGPGRDRLYLATNDIMRNYKPIKEGSEVIDPNFAGGLVAGKSKESIAVEGASERNGQQTTVYVGPVNSSPVVAVDVGIDGVATERVARINGSGCPGGKMNETPRVAVDQANGHLLTFQASEEAAREYERSGACVAEFGQFTFLSNNHRIAVDSACATHVNEDGEEEPLDETTTPTCEEYDPANGTAYIAFDDTTPGTRDLTAFEPLSYSGPPDTETLPPSAIGGGQATFNGSVNPGGFGEVSQCGFEYLEEDDYLANGEAFAGAATAPCLESAAEIGTGEESVPVHATVSIDATVPWCVRLLAANEFGANPAEALCFGPPLLLELRQPRPIAYTEATLRARIDPSGLPTTYRFAYGLAAGQYEHTTPARTLAADAGPTEVSQPIGGLTEGTEYHFQVLIENEAAAVEGADQSFATLARRSPEACPNGEYRNGLSARLPDCRAYELVTPAQSSGLLIFGNARTVAPAIINGPLTPPRGAGAGESLAYFVNGTLPGFEGNGVLDAYSASRGAGDHPVEGWVGRLFSPTYKQAAPGLESGFALDSEGLSPDQSHSIWSIFPAEPAAELSDGYYLRVPDGTANPQCLTGPLPAELDFELLGCGSLGTDPLARGRYLANGGAHVVFSSGAHLEDEAPPAGNQAIYDRPAGSSDAQVLSLPASSLSAADQAELLAAGQSKEQVAFLGASEDGAAVVFKAGAALYVRPGDGGTERVSPRAAAVGEALSCAAGPLLGLSQQRQVQWLRNGAPIPGKKGGDITTNTDYPTVAADEGAAIQCLVTASKSETASVAVSLPVEISPLAPGDTPQPPVEVPAPSPSGPGVGTVETCDQGSWEGATSFAYQWYVNGVPVPGATTQTYEVQAADVPGAIQCVVSASNAAGTVAKASALTATSPGPSEPAPVATAAAAAKATYAGISRDGRYVFYALDTKDPPARLFRFDTQTEVAIEIAPASIFANVSADGSRAFFSSTEALTGGEENDNGEAAQAGARNLYAFDFAGETTSFIARLHPDDFKIDAFGGIQRMNMGIWATALRPDPDLGLGLIPTRSTPDGSVLVFQSHARLTAYENEGVGEIYRYDPAAPAGERLTCPSCDPSGAPPSADPLLMDLSGGTPLSRHAPIPNLTDDGSALIFTSPDRLLPEDANAAIDVYEWRAAGSAWGGFAGAPHCQRPEGCLALISSGQGERDSILFAMGADGQDVFFHTLERLVPGDVVGSNSIYDAREGGGIPEPPEKVICSGDACQPEGAPPPVLPAPATTGSADGNVVKRGCPRGKRRVKGRGRCVKPHRHKRNRHHQPGKAQR